MHVPYKGGNAAITDLIAGRVDLMFESLTSIAPHARPKAIRGLGVTGTKRSAGFPELPTETHSGFYSQYRRPSQAVFHDQARVVKPGGVVAAAVWDTFGGMPSRRMFWDTVAALHPAAEPRRSIY